MTEIFLIFASLLLVVLNGFFVAAEFSLVKLRHTQLKAIQEIYGLRGKVLATVHGHLDTYLSACQLGITLASLGLGWIGEPAFAKLLEPALHSLGIFSATTISAIAFFTAFFTISVLHIVLGELAPKSLAIRKPQRISLWTALPLYYFYWVMYPFIWLLHKCANLTLRSLGDAAKHETESTHYSTEELKVILHSRHLYGGIEKEEAEILDNVLDFAELKVADIMQPLEEMVSLSLARPLAENLQITTRYRFSRYPAYEKKPENIVGILHIKDIFFATQSAKNPALTKFIRPILTVHTDLPAIELFRKFRAGLTHFTLVKHHGGALVGFITLDNIINALVGQIGDEFIRPKPNSVRTKEGNLLMKGNAPLYLLEKSLAITLPPTEANTISGLLHTTLERLPKLNENVPFDKFDITVLKMKGPRILLVSVHPH